MANHYWNTEIRIESSDHEYNQSVADLIISRVFMASFQVDEEPFIEIYEDGSRIVYFRGYGCWLDEKSKEYLRLATCSNDGESSIPSNLVIKSHSYTNSNMWETECLLFEDGKITEVLLSDKAITDFDVAFIAGYALLGDKKAIESLSCEFGKLDTTECVDSVSEILGFIEILQRLEVKPSKAALEGWKCITQFLSDLDWDDVGIYLDEDDVQGILAWLESQCLMAGTSGKKTSRGSL